MPLAASALFTGVALAVTAFPVPARIISERGLTGSRFGSVAPGAGAVNDAAGRVLMNARGLVQLIALNLGPAGIVTQAMFSALVVVAVVTTVMAPPPLTLLYRRERALGRFSAGQGQVAPPPEPGPVRIALVSPVRFAGGGTGLRHARRSRALDGPEPGLAVTGTAVGGPRGGAAVSTPRRERAPHGSPTALPAPPLLRPALPAVPGVRR
ncbi:hypothetical protein V1L54_16395 [Streptomyces sp. TRM 70361]|uniref:hypothetical protein n=1 Tax=Streptomyces sp. TRM 70361 TaxID=3116553 RepID=UPI002E7ADFA1|nr:hypothetical protein [Streptomyces sp. TRM 70361]MEE1940966.1 hypothetical protein [Streptomyces sp. TRM 70361]